MDKRGIERDLLLTLLLGLLVLLAILVVIYPPTRNFMISKVTSFLSFLRFSGAG